MATDTAGLNTALGYPSDIGQPHVVREFGTLGPYQGWYIDGGKNYAGRIRMVNTTASNSAADQATEVITALRAGPSF